MSWFLAMLPNECGAIHWAEKREPSTEVWETPVFDGLGRGGCTRRGDRRNHPNPDPSGEQGSMLSWEVRGGNVAYQEEEAGRRSDIPEK